MDLQKVRNIKLQRRFYKRHLWIEVFLGLLHRNSLFSMAQFVFQGKSSEWSAASDVMCTGGGHSLAFINIYLSCCHELFEGMINYEFYVRLMSKLIPRFKSGLKNMTISCFCNCSATPYECTVLCPKIFPRNFSRSLFSWRLFCHVTMLDVEQKCTDQQYVSAVNLQLNYFLRLRLNSTSCLIGLHICSYLWSKNCSS